MNRKKLLITIIFLTIIIILLIAFLNSNKKYSSISISENKWNSIINDKVENNNLKLDLLKFNDYNLIIDNNKNTIYYSIVNESKTKYNPDVSFKTADKNIKIAVLKDDITDEKVHNNYEFKIIIYNKSEYKIYKMFCTNFPVLNISFNKKMVNSTKNIPCEIYLFDNLSDIPNKITRSRGEIKKLEDNSYRFSLIKMSPGKNERKNNISIFNMDPRSSYLLNPVNVENMESFDETGFNENNHQVELFINGEYIGLYNLGYNLEKKTNNNE